jgi:hypothetical protein
MTVPHLFALAACGVGAPAVPELVAFGTRYNDDGTGNNDISPLLPAGIQAGDVLLAFLHRNQNSSQITGAPSGWNQACVNIYAGNNYTYVYWKVASGSESTPTFTFGGALSGEKQGIIGAWRGIDNTTPMDATATVSAVFDSSAPIQQQAPAITTVTDGAIVVSWAALNGTGTISMGTPNSFGEISSTTIADAASAGIDAPTGFYIAELVKSPAGATTAPLYAFSGASATFRLHTIALRPAA